MSREADIEERFEEWWMRESPNRTYGKDDAFDAWQSRQPEIDALVKEIREFASERVELENERDALKAQVERLRKDAERYRWLADQDLDDQIFIARGTNGTWGECWHSGFGGLKDLIDEVIDAAMKETK